MKPIKAVNRVVRTMPFAPSASLNTPFALLTAMRSI
jgi:hypothetical protein